MRTRRVMRVLARGVAVLVGLPLLAYAALVVVNWNDEPPSADAERLVAMQRDRPEVADAANGFVHARDLAAAPDADPSYRAARSAEVAELATACTEAPSCAEALDARPGAATQWLGSEQWLLDRYRRMLATRAWREPVLDGAITPLPPYQHAMEAQKLHLVDVRRLALAADPAGVRDLLERDLVFWRQVLASSDLLITKMIAAAAVRRNFAFGNLALRELPTDLVDTAVPPSWREPLTVAERSLTRPMAGEWHWIARTLGTSLAPEAAGDGSQDQIAERLLRPLFQQQATLNRVAARLVRMGTMSELPHDELGAALEHLAQPQDPESGFHVYNPIGLMLYPGGTEVAYADYIRRISDLEGQRRATLLVAVLRGAGTGREDVAVAIRDAQLRSPYDGTPFEWDAGSGSVVFAGIEEGGRRRHAVPL